jgi:hypothetical protein
MSCQRWPTAFKGEWKFEPETVNIKILPLSDDVAQTYAPTMITSGKSQASVATGRFLMYEVALRTGAYQHGLAYFVDCSRACGIDAPIVHYRACRGAAMNNMPRENAVSQSRATFKFARARFFSVCLLTIDVR